MQDAIQIMSNNFGVKISQEAGGNRRVSRALQCAKLKEASHDDTKDFVEGFKLLPRFLKELQLQNRGAIIKCEAVDITDGDNIERRIFKRLFVQLGPMVLATINSQKIAAYDAGFLKIHCWGKYQLICSGSVDGENRNVLTSFSVVPVESADNYTFHMNAQKEDPDLKSCFAQEGFSCVSDRDKGLKKSLMFY